VAVPAQTSSFLIVFQTSTTGKGPNPATTAAKAKVLDLLETEHHRSYHRYGASSAATLL